MVCFQGNCTKDNDYGFKQGKPCILLKLNRIIGWIPEEIDAKYPPEGTPSNIVEEIKKNKEEGNEDLVSRNANRNRFFVGTFSIKFSI